MLVLALLALFRDEVVEALMLNELLLFFLRLALRRTSNHFDVFRQHFLLGGLKNSPITISDLLVFFLFLNRLQGASV